MQTMRDFDGDYLDEVPRISAGPSPSAAAGVSLPVPLLDCYPFIGHLVQRATAELMEWRARHVTSTNSSLADEGYP